MGAGSKCLHPAAPTTITPPAPPARATSDRLLAILASNGGGPSRLPSARLVAAVAGCGASQLPQAAQRDITSELPTRFSSVLGYTPSQSIPNMQTPSEILIGQGTTMGLSPAGSCAQ